ncbi:mechanosensitive ion channel family protein [Alkalihalobacillus macyae]|uniref:mechanosensitive ion channel family protein n=1 Tax=Guptibacillus hwajinpoensis TaxID=208199 RepID=UPI00273B57C9|nr:mechanosensitive ion channel family protein [Alkalihalobacillus macyae]MDP4553186.1 mechanosensitive ion channel family protein [Alkalihalobacillus macyae]
MELFNNIDWAGLLVDTGLILLKLIAILIVYAIVKAIGNRFIERTFGKVSEKQNMSEGRSNTLMNLAKSIFSYVLIFMAAAIIFETFGFDIKALIAGAGIIGLAVGFGAQGLVSDVVTGFFILLEKQMDVGDYVTAGGFGGIVEEVGLRTTHIRSFDGTLNYVPNREISALSNHSRGNMRALVDIGISYDDNIDEAIRVIQSVCDNVAATNEAVIEGPDVLGVQNLGSSDVVLRVLCRTQNMEQWGVERQLRKEIKEALDANGIEIPFPHQVYVEKKEQ